MHPISAAMANPMRPAMRMAIITGASSLARRQADNAADGVGSPRSTRAGPVCRASTPPMKNEKHTDHQQTGVANFQELVKHLPPLPPGQRQRLQGVPEQQHDLPDVFKYMRTRTHVSIQRAGKGRCFPPLKTGTKKQRLGSVPPS